MKLFYSDIQECIELDHLHPYIFQIEDVKLFANMVQELFHQLDEGEGRWVLSKDNKLLRLDKFASAIIDPFHLDANQRKVLLKIYQELACIANGEEMFSQTLALKENLTVYLRELVYKSDMDLVFKDDFEFKNLFGAIDLRWDFECESLLERICTYMQVMHRFIDTQIVFFVNLKAYLQDTELQELYKMAAYHNLALVLLENTAREKLPEEKLIIIDRDLCCVYCDN